MMSSFPGFGRLSRGSKRVREEENVYSSEHASDWPAESRAALSRSMQQHAAILRGEDELDDDAVALEDHDGFNIISMNQGNAADNANVISGEASMVRQSDNAAMQSSSSSSPQQENVGAWQRILNWTPLLASTSRPLPPPPPRDPNDFHSSTSTLQTNSHSLRNVAVNDVILEENQGTAFMAASARLFGRPLERRTSSGADISVDSSRKSPVSILSPLPTDTQSSQTGGGKVRSNSEEFVAKSSDSALTKAAHNREIYTTSNSLRRTIRLTAVILLIFFVVSLGLTLWYMTHIFMDMASTTTTSSKKKDDSRMQGIAGLTGTTLAYNGALDEIPDLERLGIAMPTAGMEHNLADWRTTIAREDLPLFWTTPLDGRDNVLMDILGKCLRFIEASDKGAHHNELSLQIFETAQGIRYVNVDTTTQAGLMRARNLQLAKSDMCQVMYTPSIPMAANVFDSAHQGRLFTLFRHPVQRAMLVNGHLAGKHNDPSDMSISTIPLPNNDMVRALANKSPTDDLGEDDLYVAMELLRRKCVVGLVERMEESLYRFHHYFGWQSLLLVDGVLCCQKELLNSHADHQVGVSVPGTKTYDSILARNRLDIRLFEYAQYLFDMQGGHAQQAR